MGKSKKSKLAAETVKPQKPTKIVTGYSSSSDD